MPREIKVYDTTLRDGTQGEGVSFSMEDKVRIAQRLDALGVHYIEGGWPGSNPKDLRFFKRVQDAVFKSAKITAFGSTRRPGVRPQDDANIQALRRGGTARRHHLRQVLGPPRDARARDDARREPRP